MFSRWLRRRDPDERAWQEAAARLGLSEADGAQAMVRELLDLADDAVVGPVQKAERTGRIDAYVFWYRGAAVPRSREAVFVTASLLVSDETFSPVSWRASKKVHEVIASLQASATGGEVITVPGSEGFNDRVTVVAREPAELLPSLTPATQRVLERIVAREHPATLTVGQRRILISVTGSRPAHAGVEDLLADVLSLYAALESS